MAALALRPRDTLTRRSGDSTPVSAASWRNGKPALRCWSVPARRNGKRKSDGQFQSDIEELWPEFEGAEMGGDMAHVEAPIDGPLDLARHSFRTSSMSACSQRSTRVLGNPPSPSSREGA